MPRPKRQTPVDRYVVKTLAEIARELGVTPMRVYQIERGALLKIRAELLARRIVTAQGYYVSTRSAP
jgi:DNA-directed RNA polymerase sigma subunit (sigma70/sigma32)